MKKAFRHETTAGKLLLLAAAAIFVLAAAGAAKGAAGAGISAGSRAERTALLESLGHRPDADGETEKTVRLPKEFPAVLDNYEKLQHSQGFSLKKYAGKEIKIYTCPLLDGGREEVYSTLYVYKGRVIGGDIHSVNFEGYMQPLCPADNDENG